MHLLSEQYPTAEKFETDCFCLRRPYANHDGILYQAGETVIIADDNGFDLENVACVDAFIGAVVDDQFYFCLEALFTLQ